MTVAPETVAAISLPPREAIRFLAQKVNVTTSHWTDVWRSGHARAFMVAGAATDALVADFRDAVARAIEQGRTPADFRRDFDDIVSRNGWVHNGSAAWRANLIYDVNLSMAYAAGRWAQQTRPEVLAAFPFLQYQHSGAENPRLQHLAWNGLVLRADDPWWQTHYPPNGWRCGCRARSRSARDLARMGKAVPDAAPAVTTREWTNPRTGERSEVPQGIDPGFDYNVGSAWQGNALPAIPGNATRTPPPGWTPQPPAIPPARPPAPPTADEVEDTRANLLTLVRRLLGPEEARRLREASVPELRASVGRAIGRRPEEPSFAARRERARREAPPSERPLAFPDVAQAEAWLNGQQAAWRARLTVQERAAIRFYRIAEIGRAMNRVLREGSDGGTLRPLIERLSLALRRAPMPATIRAWRGVPPGAYADKLRAMQVGDEEAERAFVSTSINPAVARDYGEGVVLEVIVPKGYVGAGYVDRLPPGMNLDQELLFRPGARWRVSARTATGLRVEMLR